MKEIQNLEDATKYLNLKKLGVRATSDILFEVFLKNSKDKIVDSQIIIIDEKEKFSKPLEEPMVDIIIGKCRKQVFINKENEINTIIYTYVGPPEMVDVDLDVQIACNYIQQNSNATVVDLQRELCLAYSDALKIYKILVDKGILKEGDSSE